MSQMMIDCPSCTSSLLVPEAAAGRKARCTACDSRFIIPSLQEMLEQTISHLALEELDHRYHKQDMNMLGVEQPAPRPQPRSGHPTTKSGTVLGMAVSADPRSRGDASRPRADGNPPPSPRQASVTEAIAGTSRVAESATRGVAAMAGRQAHHRPPEQPPASAPEGATRADEDDGLESYPQQLRPTGPRPYLVVLDVTVLGVRLAFAAEWLMNEMFRTSMPVRCAFSGKGPTAGLVSRPMIFVNRCRDVETQVRALEMQYEQAVGAKHSAREHALGIGRLEGMHEPFDRPLLYYASASRTSDALCCEVRGEEEGRERCEVLIPHGDVAVDWISRVNGRCGPEYGRLKSAVTTLVSDAWTGLPDGVRKRLDTWCRFERGERFKLYLNDADFTAADAGLGGVVVTDRRLLHHKFRRSRSLSLNQDATLHLRTDEKFVQLTLESHGRMVHAGKIHRGDMNPLIQALADAPRLKVMVAHGAPMSEG